jgi:hypothetical protein
MAGTVRPGLLAVEGVTGVSAVGTRISEEPEQRLAEALDSEQLRAGTLHMLQGYRSNPDQTKP